MLTIQGVADAPVIFLSIYREENAKARALDMGAADYEIKPLSSTELAARIRAALRQRAGPVLADLIQPQCVRDLTIQYAEHSVKKAGRDVQLTATELELLKHLSMAVGRVQTQDQLLYWVWGPERTGEPWLVRNVVKRLWNNLGDNADNPIYILTESRVGYRMPKGEESN